MLYLALKNLHVSCVVLSGAGFVLRGFWMLFESSLLSRRWVKVAPHFVDTALLLSGVSMAVISAQYPFAQDWLSAKLFGLFAYVLCGAVALKRGRTKAVRAIFFMLALAVYAYIVSVAFNRHPAGWLVGYF